MMMIIMFISAASERPNGVGIKGVGQFLCSWTVWRASRINLFWIKSKKQTNPFYTDPIRPLRSQLVVGYHSILWATSILFK